MTERRPSCEVCGLAFLSHKAAEEKVPPAARHLFRTHPAAPRTVQDGLDIPTTPDSALED